MQDPDRFFQFDTPGAQEWWYFDAVSADGRDALAIVWYAGLPFDPAYGVASLRHLSAPGRYPKPNPLDHCAIGVGVYRDGKTIGYALNSFRASSFSHRAEPFSVEVAGNRLDRRTYGYRLHVDTPSVDGKTPIRMTLRFAPASATIPLERDFGAPGSSHVWCLAAADCSVRGDVSIGEERIAFRGRGYHDHNAGELEISRAIRRWRWGRVHQGPFTHIYYAAEPHIGPASSVWITCRNGKPERVRSDVDFTESNEPGGNVFGVRHGRSLAVTAGSLSLVDDRGACVDNGPFYRRWVGPIHIEDTYDSPEDQYGENVTQTIGISELLDTRNLNRRLFNWMIPFRLKRPKDSGARVSGIDSRLRTKG